MFLCQPDLVGRLTSESCAIRCANRKHHSNSEQLSEPSDRWSVGGIKSWAVSPLRGLKLISSMPTYVFDDVFGDQRPGSTSPPPAYSPSVDQWDAPRGTCSGCSMSTNIKIPVDTSQVMNGTWHTVTVNPGEPITNVTITFTGK